MKYHSAWVDISCKVFVEEDELMEKLNELYPDKCRWDKEEAEWINETTYDEQKEAFEELAQEKISAMFQTDEPMKFNEAAIDMSTYRSYPPLCGELPSI